MGRPRGTDNLTPEVHASIVKWMEGGNYLETAAPLSGVPIATARRWLRRGAQQRRGKFRDFLDAVKKAEAKAEARNVLRIEQASAKSWFAAAWWLERKIPQRWGATKRHEVTGKGGKDLFAQQQRNAAAAVAAALAISEEDEDDGSDKGSGTADG